ncbi:MAK16-like nucleolar RNA binding protein, putative [Ostreococcus lucimarinus CCE9901]|uniref:Protein MAK16 homolog n=1 Tax=Ostreococcus lucimarinus (strain CCE9901) TaxID=436017 RepID=A4RSW6_OSTLU|nr:MAK16-like nucleolar RNA binding protein, putative [Ostreococcus lucimarinus CCE9901]ABO94716.1 MAK16-like nucleolar RNA binding protein, putative [Ostreococcus lucimarinus CCE9901]|eukprot:XP_001416423.1 MAK16-like nucleolar RNA binding protein, putative [Ostreococcus lucimarinus CCE9901]
MQSDEVVWQIINHGQCSYRATSETSNFCRNEFSLTGMCNRSSCPLSNSQYATIREECGILNLYTKTVERSHMPSKLWEKTELSPKYAEALEQINSSLRHWPKFLVHKSKQRLTKLTQLLIRSRKLEKVGREKIQTMPARHTQRDARAESKAQVAARLDSSIENELLERLNAGVYESSYQFSTARYSHALEGTRKMGSPETKTPRKIRQRRLQREIEYEQIRTSVEQ